MVASQLYLTLVAPYVLTYAGLYAVDLFVPDLLGAFLDAALRCVRRDHHESVVQY